jgi:hypothetical protein
MWHVEQVEDSGECKVLWRNLTETAHLKNIGMCGRIRVNRILKRWYEEAWTGLIWLRIGAGGWLL